MRVFRFDTEAEAVAFAKGVWACNVSAITAHGIRSENHLEGVEFVNGAGITVHGIRSKAKPTPNPKPTIRFSG